MAKSFSNWVKWTERNELIEIKNLGVYALAYTQLNISNRKFADRPEIIYFGMTNAIGGLRSRLNQFDHAIKGGRGHGSGQRVRFKYPDYNHLSQCLYVSVMPFECDVESNEPEDLRIKGDVAQQEYECSALFVEKFGRLPEFNDMKRSPKK